MSLIVQSLGGANLTATGGTTAGASGNGTVNTAIPFAQTLVQSMGGTTAKAADAPVMGNLATLLQGLLSAVQAKGDESGSTDSAVKNADLLEGLAQDMEKLDASLEADPALLAALQGWLLQVAALLSGSNPASQEGGADAAPQAAGGISPLAQNPATLRFAVQDELNSLVNLVQDAAASGNEEIAGKGTALVNQFSAILAESAPVEGKGKAKTGSSSDGSDVMFKQAAGTESKQDIKDKGIVASTVRILTDATVKSESSPAATPVTGVTETADDSTVLPATGLSAVMKKAVAEDEALPAAKTSTDEHEVVTAGQLSLRGGITAPLKAEAAPVPVPQFAQEMSTFITGKLEIVKKGGVAEATITLFPENLGQVDVKITMHNGNLVASFLTEHAGAKDALEQQMNQLRSALQSQGLQVEKLEVTQNSNSPQSQFNGQQGQQAGAGGQQGRRSKERREESGAAEAVLAAELNGEWKDWVAATQQENGQNGGFSAKI